MGGKQIVSPGAIEQLNNNLTINESTPTPKTGFSFTNKQTSLFKINSIVHFYGAFGCSNALTANTNYSVATIPDTYKPKGTNVAVSSAVVMDSTGKNISACRAWIDNTDLCFATGATIPSGTGAIVYFSMAYLA